ncbi:J domain-containing protein [Methanoculleus sp.]|uniref:J domain-containing protein n=1 Tax=Methanoculleus sp. TaxID=90427 RepID=UPI0025D51929|nr:J domain-containing protein [Methanoculleus sp.]
METYYDILDVPPDAAVDEIRAAYRRLAKQYHPDVNSDPDASERFIAIQQAYETLIDPDARARYDLALQSGNTSGPHDPFQWYRPGGQTSWAPGFSWQGQVPRSGMGRVGVIALLFVGGILIVLMLMLSLIFRVAAGSRRRQDS